MTGYLTKRIETGSGRVIGIPVFFEALFTIAKIWKQPKCLLTDEWIKKMWNTHKMEYIQP